MPYTDLLRITVFLTGAEATALGAITALAAGRDNDTTTVARRRRLVADRARPRHVPGAAVRAPPTASATPSPGPAPPPRCPRTSPGRIVAGRLWPIGLTAIAAGILGVIFPGVAAIGAGYALLVALTMRTREAAVLGIEHRDGVKFYVVPNSALQPDRAGAHAGPAQRPAARALTAEKQTTRRSGPSAKPGSPVDTGCPQSRIQNRT